MSSRKTKAIELFDQRYNCAQAVFLAYSDDLSEEEKDIALKLASGFGGGIAGTGEVCGVITGAVMALRTQIRFCRCARYGN